MKPPAPHAWVRRPAAAAGLAVVLLLAAGCASPPPGAAPPHAALPPGAMAWQAPLPAAGIDAVAQPGADWPQLNDAALPPLIDAAWAVSPTLAGAAARIERARAARVAAGAAALPQLSAVGSASQGRNVPGQPTATSASLGLQAGWEIDLFGGVAAGRDAAQARLEGAQAGWQAVRVALAAEVATSYTALRACEAQLVQSRADAQSRAETARLTDASERAGFVAPADAALARAGAAQARSIAVNQAASCDTLVKSLVEATALAEPDLRQRLATGTARLPQPTPLRLDSLPAALLERRPDLVEAARTVAAAAGERDQAQARQRPQVSLSGAVAAASLRSTGFTTDGSTWSLGPLVVSLPLFDGGARAAATDAARASYDEAVAVYLAQVRRAVREVESSLLQLQATARRQDDAASAARDFEASLQATAARQRGGLASLLDLETARRHALAAQSALIELQRERATAWIDLYRALGGGWDGTLPAPRTAQKLP